LFRYRLYPHKYAKLIAGNSKYLKHCGRACYHGLAWHGR